MLLNRADAEELDDEKAAKLVNEVLRDSSIAL
jgi:hypothetical protein